MTGLNYCGWESDPHHWNKSHDSARIEIRGIYIMYILYAI